MSAQRVRPSHVRHTEALENRVLLSAVVGRHVFYNNSYFDGNDVAANAQDDGAIAPDKQALLPGGTATFANYTSYSRGLNGVMVDISGLNGRVPTARDLEFRVGNVNDGSTWAVAPAPGPAAVTASR